MLQIFKSMESGPLQELTLKTLEKGAWINIVDPTPYELKVVSTLPRLILTSCGRHWMMKNALIPISKTIRSWS